MAVLPSEIPTGLVTGQFYFVNEDNVDADTNPELQVVTGKVRFTCEADKPLRMPTKKAVVIPLTFDAEFNSSGQLVSVSDNSIGLKLPATNSALFNPTGFTWKVTFELVDATTGHTVVIPSFSMSVPEGVTTDLVDAMPVSTSPGTITVQGPQGTQGPQGIQGPVGPGIPAGGAALQMIRKDASGTATEWFTIAKGDVGLGNVNNTSDANKPVSTATQNALNGKVDNDALAILAPAPNGTDDTAALQTVLSQAGSSALTRRVIGRTGTYIVTTLTIPAGVTLANIKILHKAGAAAGAAAITLSGIAGKVENVEIDGNVTNQPNAGILGIVLRADRTTAEGCYVHDVQWDGIVVASNPLYVSVRNNRVIFTGRYGITLNGAVGTCPRGTVVHGNYVERSNDGGLGIVGVAEDTIFSSNVTRDTGGDGIAAYSGSNIGTVCVGNVFYNPGNNGIHLGGTDLLMADNKAYNVYNTAWFIGNAVGQGSAAQGVIANNLVDTVGKFGIWVQSSTDITITGNLIKNVTREQGAQLEEVDGFTFNNNTISGNAVGRGLFLIRSRKGTVMGNHIHDVTAEAIYGRDYSTGTLRCHYITVTGNTIYNASAGIASSEGSNFWLVSSNVMTGLTGSAVSLAGTNNSIGTNLTV